MNKKKKKHRKRILKKIKKINIEIKKYKEMKRYYDLRLELLELSGADSSTYSQNGEEDDISFSLDVSSIDSIERSIMTASTDQTNRSILSYSNSEKIRVSSTPIMTNRKESPNKISQINKSEPWKFLGPETDDIQDVKVTCIERDEVAEFRHPRSQHDDDLNSKTHPYKKESGGDIGEGHQASIQKYYTDSNTTENNLFVKIIQNTGAQKRKISQDTSTHISTYKESATNVNKTKRIYVRKKSETNNNVHANKKIKNIENGNYIDKNEKPIKKINYNKLIDEKAKNAKCEIKSKKVSAATYDEYESESSGGSDSSTEGCEEIYSLINEIEKDEKNKNSLTNFLDKENLFNDPSNIFNELIKDNRRRKNERERKINSEAQSNGNSDTDQEREHKQYPRRIKRLSGINNFSLEDALDFYEDRDAQIIKKVNEIDNLDKRKRKKEEELAKLRSEAEQGKKKVLDLEGRKSKYKAKKMIEISSDSNPLIDLSIETPNSKQQQKQIEFTHPLLSDEQIKIFENQVQAYRNIHKYTLTNTCGSSLTDSTSTQLPCQQAKLSHGSVGGPSLTGATSSQPMYQSSYQQEMLSNVNVGGSTLTDSTNAQSSCQQAKLSHGSVGGPSLTGMTSAQPSFQQANLSHNNVGNPSLTDLIKAQSSYQSSHQQEKLSSVNVGGSSLTDSTNAQSSYQQAKLSHDSVGGLSLTSAQPPCQQAKLSHDSVGGLSLTSAQPPCQQAKLSL
jgi:uncharacterized protein YjbI with pentapeptide repeats